MWDSLSSAFIILLLDITRQRFNLETSKEAELWYQSVSSLIFQASDNAMLSWTFLLIVIDLILTDIGWLLSFFLSTKGKRGFVSVGILFPAAWPLGRPSGDPWDQIPYISTQGSDSICWAITSFLYVCLFVLSSSNNRIGGKSRKGFMSLDISVLNIWFWGILIGAYYLC